MELPTCPNESLNFFPKIPYLKHTPYINHTYMLNVLDFYLKKIVWRDYRSTKCTTIHQFVRIPASKVSVFRSSTVQSMVWILAITADVTSLAWRYKSSSSKSSYSFYKMHKYNIGLSTIIHSIVDICVWKNYNLQTKKWKHIVDLEYVAYSVVLFYEESLQGGDTDPTVTYVAGNC